MTDTLPQKQAAWQRLYDAILRFQAIWIADIGLKAGLFRAIVEGGPGGVAADDLADRLGYHPRYVQVWCRAAFALELLDWNEASGYRLAPFVDALLLDPTDPQYLGGRLQFFAALAEDFRAFPDSLRTGRVWPRSEHDPWLLEALKRLTEPDAAVVTEAVLPQAPATLARLEAGGTILDVGSGAGYAVTHYARRFPRARVVGLEFDRPSVALAEAAVAAAGVADRVEIRHADANLLDEEGVYDLITLNIALHETGGPAEYRNVLRRVRRALTVGGTVLVSELPYPDSPAEYRSVPVYQMLAGLQIHEAQVGCGMITQGELAGLLAETGFADARVATQPLPARFMMLAGKGTEPFPPAGAATAG